MPDMTPRELMTLAPLLVLTLFFGVYPAPILDTVAASVENLLKTMQVAAAHLDTITLTMK
jgi:NADH-quinone oxidoreductase subunit M